MWAELAVDRENGFAFQHKDIKLNDRGPTKQVLMTYGPARSCVIRG